jgi:ribose/xylose/arabinose/galactoside ABC-type transport system permease subunit
LKAERFRNFVIEQKILLIILAIGIFLWISSDYFLTFQNITNIFQTISFEGMIVIGMAILIIIGEIDLSVGSTMAFGAALAVMFQSYGVVTGIIAGILGGVVIGLLNGLITTKLKLPSIAVTLGMMVFLNGVVFALTKEHTLKGTNENFVLISQTEVLRIPLPVIVFIVLMIIFEIILQRSIFGRHIFAIGGNATASKFFGIKVDMVRIICFTITGFLAGLAGVMLAGKLNIASGRIGGDTAVFVITAVLLGGISMEGGEGSIYKAFQGILLLGIMNNAMVIMKISAFIQEMIRGLLLILIVVIDAINIQKKKYL